MINNLSAIRHYVPLNELRKIDYKPKFSAGRSIRMNNDCIQHAHGKRLNCLG